MSTRRSTATSLLYGGSGNRKTSQIGNFARHVYQTTGKRTRLITADTGGYEPIQDYVDAGLIEVFELTKTRNPMPTVRRLAAGQWADHNEVVEFGLTNPGSTLGTDKLKQLSAMWSSAGLEDVGAYAIEGITSISEMVMKNLVQKGHVINGEGVNGVLEEGMSIGAAPRTYYGVVQQFVVEMFTNFPLLPVHRILYTAHESRGVDGLTDTPVFGPASVGKAMTASIPKYVGDLLHAEAVPLQADPKKPGNETLEVRCYFVNHPDSERRTLTWPAKARVQPSQMTELLKQFPGGYVLLNHDNGLDTYLQALAGLRGNAAEGVKQWMASVATK